MKFLPPPGPARTRQLALLGVLMIGAAYALSRLGTSGAPARPPIPASNIQTAARPAQKAAAASTSPQPLQLDKLEPVEELPPTARDPFRFGVRPPPPPPPAPPYVPPPPQPPPRPVVPPGPVIPPITLKFIGRVVRPDRRVVATLSDGRQVFEATEGMIVDGRYRLLKIGEESLLIEYVDGTGRATLPLRGS
jgi:hypothetical protein